VDGAGGLLFIGLLLMILFRQKYPRWCSALSTCGCIVRSAPAVCPTAAPAYGRQHGITVIDGGCPLMFEPDSGLRPQGDALRPNAHRQCFQVGFEPTGLLTAS
jgi:hypothetical protein